MSDLHLEFAPFGAITPLPTDKDGILVLAGDICPYVYRELLFPFLERASAQFAYVFYVLGNHEFYGLGTFPQGYRIVQNVLQRAQLTNVHVLQDEHFELGDVTFIGSTLWTDFRNNPNTMELARTEMGDYDEICGTNGSWITPSMTLDRHLKSRTYIFEKVAEAKKAGRKVVLITHHGVSSLSVHSRFFGDSLNDAFVSDLSNEILDTKPDLVVHGHVHNRFDYMLGETRVIVNPRGYPKEYSSTGFDELLTIEI